MDWRVLESWRSQEHAGGQSRVESPDLSGAGKTVNVEVMPEAVVVVGSPDSDDVRHIGLNVISEAPLSRMG